MVAALISGSVSAHVAWYLIDIVNKSDSIGTGFWMQVVAAWLLAWVAVEQLAAIKTLSRFYNMILGTVIPVVFGVWLLVLWELLTRRFDAPQVLLPSPSMIADQFAQSTSILWADFKQTFLKSVLIGYALGCDSGFIGAILIDRSPLLSGGSDPVISKEPEGAWSSVVIEKALSM